MYLETVDAPSESGKYSGLPLFTRGKFLHMKKSERESLLIDKYAVASTITHFGFNIEQLGEECTFAKCSSGTCNFFWTDTHFMFCQSVAFMYDQEKWCC